jgi:glyoxylate reductase
MPEIMPDHQVARPDGKPRVVVTRRLLPANHAQMAELFDAVFNEEDRPMGRDELVAAMRACDVLVPCVTDRIDAAMLAETGGRLRLIANFGAGIEHIDMAAARAAGIMVTNTPGVFTEDTADLAMALILFATRRFGASAQVLRAGDWQGWGPSAMLGHALGGKLLGIVGMGQIGQAVARRARAFGMGIVYYNRNPLPAALEAELGARYETDLDSLIAAADVVSLHCPATPETENLIDARRIAMMKPTACLVNTARGALIDEDVLVEALARGHLAGAGLDVYRGEPQVDPRLLALPNVIALPHLGSATFEGREEAGERIIANICAWAEGLHPPDLVP